MTRRTAVAWTEMVPCLSCAQSRPITATHRWYFQAAARKTCRRCQNVALNANRTRIADGPTVPYARKYQPDQDLCDWVVVDRLISGQRVSSTRAERVAAVAELTKFGLAAAAIADRIGITQRSVERLRAVVRAEVDRQSLKETG